MKMFPTDFQGTIPSPAATTPASPEQPVLLPEDQSGDRRANTRHPCKLSGDCGPLTQAGPSSRWAVTASDLSTAGVGLFACRRFEVGTGLRLRMSSETEGSTRMLFARVVRVNPRLDGTFFLGCALDRELPADELTELL
jgi:hypothetical protein